MELSGREVKLVVRSQSQGKTPGVREQCENSNADALLVLDADTVLTQRNYVSRLIENLFKGAGVASACGEVSPLTRSRRKAIIDSHPVARPCPSGAGSRARRPFRPFPGAARVSHGDLPLVTICLSPANPV